MKTALAGLAALAVAMGIGRFAFTPLLPMMQADAGLTLAQGGWLASANYLGYLIGALTAGRIRADVAVRGGLSAIVLATLAMALSENPLLWLLLRFAAGVASAWVLVHVSAYSLRRLHARLSGTVYAGVGAGIALAGFVCLAFMAQGIASRQAWIALGAIALVLSVAVWRFFDRPEAAPLAAAHQPLGAQARRLVLCYGAYGFGYIIPATFIRRSRAS